jgi:hypothetical protein
MNADIICRKTSIYFGSRRGLFNYVSRHVCGGSRKLLSHCTLCTLYMHCMAYYEWITFGRRETPYLWISMSCTIWLYDFSELQIPAQRFYIIPSNISTHLFAVELYLFSSSASLPNPWERFSLANQGCSCSVSVWWRSCVHNFASRKQAALFYHTIGVST